MDYVADNSARLCKICREDKWVLCCVPAAFVSAVSAGQARSYLPACFYVFLPDEFTSGGEIRGERMAAPLHVYLHFYRSAAI